MQPLLGHSKIKSTVRYLGIDVGDAIDIAEKIDIRAVDAQNKNLSLGSDAERVSNWASGQQRQADLSRAVSVGAACVAIYVSFWDRATKR